jgi:aliphatic nitrilase
MSVSVKATALQIDPVLYSRRGTVENVLKTIHGLGKQGVQEATTLDVS